MENEKISWNVIDEAIEKLTSMIKQSGVTYNAIYALPRGGLVAGVMLSHRLGIPLTLNMESVLLLKHQGSNVLIVDDISDSGKTLKHFHEDKYDIATLYVRKHTTIVMPKYGGIYISHDRWLLFPWEYSENI